ncbi:hypothetical protein Sango_0444400 [Sesamum angolense]|uniref:Uncharacterized protein n=1 Tax=Sesamum angolense TaxID=2727404 RepID=A0AAE2C4E2_9LAMI|nr:hypothetical protein Sango_0444400 [Sesamum angolense]
MMNNITNYFRRAEQKPWGAKRVGTKKVASEVGAGAGACAAETPLTAESMTIINATATIFIFMASICVSVVNLDILDRNCYLPQILRFSHTEMDKLQWGNRKRLRELGMSRSTANDNRKASASLSPEKEDRYYTTRGSGGFDVSSKALFANPKEENRKIVWPKLLITLSSKEKEEDFMAMKGCKPPQRPKKRAKLIQRTILLVSPGAWLTDLCQERYEVREKKTSKKKPRGLKAMGSMESDSDDKFAPRGPKRWINKKFWFHFCDMQTE